MGRKTVLLVVAVVIATLGASLVYLYVRGANDKAIASQEPVTVLTVTEEIAAGESLEDAEAAGKLAQSDIAGSAVTPGALTATTDIADQVALTTLYPGEQVLASKWGDNAAVSNLGIPEKRLAVSAQLGDPNRVAGFVQPGSDVAIWWTGTLPGADGDAAAPGTGETSGQEVRLLLEDVTVLGAGDTTTTSRTVTDPSGAQTVESLPKTLLTLSVDQDEAEKIILGGKTGELWFALRGDETALTLSEGLTVDELFD